MEKIYVLIKVETGYLESVAAEIKTFSDIESVDVVTGTYDIIVSITGENVAGMLSQVVRDIRGVQGIMTTETLVALNLD